MPRATSHRLPLFLSEANNLRLEWTRGAATGQKALKAWPHVSHFVAALRST